jgi:hypothetical protein
MWPFFTLMKAGPDGFGWLTEEVKQQYREVWGAGLTGACNLYRVTPMKPPLPGQTTDGIPVLPRERLTVNVPTFVFWALDDAALLPGLLEGLEDYVPKLEVKKVPGATHWIVHEQPQLVAREIEAFLQRASVDRRVAFGARLEAAMHPVVLGRHRVDVALQPLVHERRVGLDVVGRKVLPGRQHLDLVAAGRELRHHRHHLGLAQPREARERRHGGRLHAVERHEDRLVAAEVHVGQQVQQAALAQAPAAPA